MEAIYDNVPDDIGFLAFAPQQEARGAMYSARNRAGQKGEPVALIVEEHEHYSGL
nr:hypothetical protein [uncultured Deefgea sp.]